MSTITKRIAKRVRGLVHDLPIFLSGLVCVAIVQTLFTDGLHELETYVVGVLAAIGVYTVALAFLTEPLVAAGRRRRNLAYFRRMAVTAYPGSAWTATWEGRDIWRRPFREFISGPVRVLGDECPVPAYRGQKVLGELRLDDPPRVRWFEGLLPTRGQWFLDPVEDFTPVIDDPDPATAPARFAALADGADVAVEHRSDHPVYAGLRFLHEGVVGPLKVLGGERGRNVGDSWVPVNDVVAVEADGLIEPATASAEPASKLPVG